MDGLAASFTFTYEDSPDVCMDRLCQKSCHPLLVVAKLKGTFIAKQLSCADACMQGSGLLTTSCAPSDCLHVCSLSVPANQSCNVSNQPISQLAMHAQAL